MHPVSHWNGYRVVAKGAFRICLESPDDPNLLLKFSMNDPRTPSLRARVRRWWARRAPHRLENAIEWRAWETFIKPLPSAHQQHFARCVGLIDTDIGRALVVERVCHWDGKAAPSLMEVMAHRGPYAPRELCLIVDALVAVLRQHRIPLFDINPQNLVVCEQPEGLRLVCIDLKSALISKELLPISRMVPMLREKKLLRRAERLRRRILAAWGEAAAAPETGAARAANLDQSDLPVR